MKICWKLEIESPDLKIICWQISISLVIWLCCCCQGDEARPVSNSHVSPITCHVIFEKNHRRHVTKTCSCKCWVWCKNTKECGKWKIPSQTQLLKPQYINENLIYKFLSDACSDCCGGEPTESNLFGSIYQASLRCNQTLFVNSSYCDNHITHNWCCSIFCFNEQSVGPCLFIYPNSSSIDLYQNAKYVNNSSGIHQFSNETKQFLKRKKRSSTFQLPYHIEVFNNQKEFVVHQPFDVTVQLKDELGTLVPDTGRKVKLQIHNHKRIFKRKIKLEEFDSFFHKGRTIFSNISFRHSGDNYSLSVLSRSSPKALSWTSESITVNYRPLTLRQSGRSLPISPKENDTLSPAAGVIIYDEMNNKPASKTYLAQYAWECTVSLLYPDVYPGKILGTTTKIIQDGSNEIIFDDVVISNWGYSYILKIELKAINISYWNLTYFIGPFDVDKYDTFELPLIESDEYRRTKIVFDNSYSIVRKDQRKFEIFFLNHFGRKFNKVRWKNITVSKGSIIVDSIITGLTEDLENTSAALEAAIENDKANIVYDGTMLKANKIFLPSRKLLEESSNSESSDEGAGGLSVAWIVAIIVNVLLIVVFILAIVYCYCRRKKQREMRSATSTLHNFDEGPNPLLFGNKDQNHKKLQDKAAIFTIEDNHRQTGYHKSMSGRMHRDDDRCNCQSPKCYCSVGDGRQTEMTFRHSEEENEDDPQGYPTPSPEPKFPTPEPSPEPEDYWRPDSYQQQEEEEPEEEEDMFLPGAVSEPSPELPQEERFYVYLLTDIDGSRELVGQIYLKVDAFLSETRRSIDRDRDLSEVIEGREFRFLDEHMEVIPGYQESTLDLERIFPSQGINIQFLPSKAPTPKPDPPPRPKLPAYVGPLGICNASDCTTAAKIKCLDCRNVAYCSKRCARVDAKDHKRNCFKPAWRV